MDHISRNVRVRQRDVARASRPPNVESRGTAGAPERAPAERGVRRSRPLLHARAAFEMKARGDPQRHAEGAGCRFGVGDAKLAESIDNDRVTVCERRGFESRSEIRVGRRERSGPGEVIERRTIVSITPVCAGERAEEIAVLACVLLGRTKNFKGLGCRTSACQRGAEADAGVHVGRMISKDRAKRSFSFLRSAESEIESRHPQPRVDIGRILLGDALEQIDGFNRAACPRELLGTGAIRCRRRLSSRNQQNECGSRQELWNEGNSTEEGGGSIATLAGLQPLRTARLTGLAAAAAGFAVSCGDARGSYIFSGMNRAGMIPVRQ